MASVKYLKYGTTPIAVDYAYKDGSGRTITSTYALASDFNTFTGTIAPATYQPLDADLTAIAALSGTSGLLKKTAADTWALDTNTYATQTWVGQQGYLTASAANLSNYYTKTEIDTTVQTLNNSITGHKQFQYESVESLPETPSADTMYKIYLVPASPTDTNNVKNEFITLRSGTEGSYTYSWEQIGSTALDTSPFIKNIGNASTSFVSSVKDAAGGLNKQFFCMSKVSTVTNAQDLPILGVFTEGLIASQIGFNGINLATGERIGNTISVTDAGTTTFVNFLKNANKSDPMYLGSWGSNENQIVLTAIGGDIKTSSKTIATSVTNTDDTVPTSKAVYTQLSGKQATLTAGTGISIGTVNNVANTISWVSPFTVEDVTI